MRKILYIIVALAFASVCRAQITPDFNMMVEAEGMGNEATGLGGFSCTVGYQISPNLFLGGGLKNIWGGRREFTRYRHHTVHHRWYQRSRDNTYWIDSNGNRYVYHAFDKDGNEEFFDYDYSVWDPEKNMFVSKDFYDENGNLLTDFRNNNDWEYECDDIEFAFKMIPYVCVRYNLFADKRISPYGDLRFGWDMLRNEGKDKYGMDLNVMAGLRMALKDGDQALCLSMGLAVTDMREYSSDDVLGVEKMFMIRLGFEF